MRAALVSAFLLSIVLACVIGVYSGRLKVPDEWNPWAPLRVDEPLHWLTRLKLARLSSDKALCQSVLAQAQMSYQPVADLRTGKGCSFDNAVRIERTSVRVGPPFTLSCRSAVALALWERHVMHPAARVHFEDTVVRVEHLGSYVCRGVYGLKDAPLSRHATADALDIAGFTLASGRRVSVERDWAADNESGRFLRTLRDGACRVFDGVLGPDYNAAHRNHFHLDRGDYRACR